MQEELPTISIVIPTYNEEKRIQACLSSIFSQDYPKNKIEVIIVDDDSTDNTVNIAKMYPVKILRNGNHNCEIGKSIGLLNAKNELVLFIDADNVLPSSSWLKKLVKPFLEYRDIVGAEPIYFCYNKRDSPANRYCSLFGVNDPLAFYLKRRDRLMWIEKEWNLLGAVEDKGEYYIAKFEGEEIPTLGSIGFLGKKSLLLKTDCSAFFFHMDSNYELIKMGYNKYALVKECIVHYHAESVTELLKKLKRNIGLYLKYKSRRKYKWITKRTQLLVTVVLMVTFVRPLYDSLRGYAKIRDTAWFLHPFICFCAVIMYGLLYSLYVFTSIKSKLKITINAL